MTLADRPPWRASMELGDFDGFEAAFGKWNGRFSQMSRGSFRGRLSVASGRHLRAFRAETNQSILTQGAADEDSVTVIPVTRGSEGTRWHGRMLERGDLLIRGTAVEYDNQSSRDACIEALLVPKRLIERSCEILTDGEMRLDWASWHGLRPDPASTRRLYRRLSALLLQPRPGIRSHEAMYDEAETLRCIVDALSSAAGLSARPFRAGSRDRLVARAKACMQDRLSEPLTAMDLCASLGVSDRLLRLAFKEAHGMGPMAYLRLLRLHAIRDALRAARDRDIRVGEILDCHGITRPAAFAGEYRRHFGELPSETLGLRERY